MYCCRYTASESSSLVVVQAPVGLDEIVPAKVVAPQAAEIRHLVLEFGQGRCLIQRCLETLHPDQEQQQGYPNGDHEGLVVDERVDLCWRSPVHMIQPNRKAGSRMSGIRSSPITRPIQASMISGIFDQTFGIHVLPGAWLNSFISMVSQRLMLWKWRLRLSPKGTNNADCADL